MPLWSLEIPWISSAFRLFGSRTGDPEYITDLSGRVQNWRIFTASFNLRTESGEHLEWNWIPQFEHLRFRWLVRPGNDLSVVLNRGWEHREFEGELIPSFDKGTVKIQYTFRF